MLAFKMSDFEVQGEIGSGSFACVNVVTDRTTHEKMALKIYKYMDEDCPEYEADFLREISFMVSLKHPCIASVRGVLVDKTELGYVMEYMENGSLRAVLEALQRGEAVDGFGPTQKSIIAYGVASAMRYLHEEARPSGAVIHRDLKSGNILLGTNFYPKIADFGFAKLFRNDYNTSKRGSWPWMAPEVMTSSHYGPEADVFSFAMLLYEMLTGQLPFPYFTTVMEYADAVGSRGERPLLTHDSGEMGELIQKCWQQDPSQRLKFREISDYIESEKYLFEGTDLPEFRQFVDLLKKL